MSLNQQSAAQLLSGLQAGEYSSEEVAQSFVDQIVAFDGQVGSFLNFDAEDVLQQARAVDSRRADGASNQLAGLPVALKDVICVQDRPTTCASRMLEKFVSPYDATAVEKLRQANGILLGKTNLDEFAMGGSTENSALGITRNPWNLKCVPGGSSGGAATCIAARMAPLSLGSDTGGSVRQPAAFCGVTGLKPTYGRISRYGLVAFASSLDQIGILARDARDTALLLNVCAGHDPRDSTSSPVAVENYLDELETPIRGLRIGLPREYFSDEATLGGLDPEIRSALAATQRILENLGASFTEISLPMTAYGVATYYLVASCEASGNLARYDGAHYGFRADPVDASAADPREASENELLRMYRQTRSQGFGTEVKRRIMLGTYALSSGYYDAYYLQALRSRRLIQDELKAAFQQVDLILGPTTPTTAYPLGEKTSDPLAMYLGDIYTVVANLAGIPAISFPAGLSSQGLPIGLQLQGPAFSESRLLQVTHAFQSRTDWHRKHPPIGSLDSTTEESADE